MTQLQALQVLKSGANIFLTGEPGSGKTYTINMFAEWLHEEKYVYPSVTASTGIAATHIDGSTIHSWSGLGIIDVPLSMFQIDAIITKPYIARRLENCRVLIIDEVSMLNATIIDNVDTILRHAIGKNSELPFGGIQVIFVGDFYQLPPVSKKGAVPFAFESIAWSTCNLKVCYITEQHRQEDAEYLEILTNMRQGTLTKDNLERLKACRKPVPDELKTKITRLSTHRKDVDHINVMELAKLSGDEHIFKMESEGVPYVLEQLKKSCLSPEKLVLKIGALVMFTRNNFDAGYVNGSVGFVIDFDRGGHPLIEMKNGQRIYPEIAEWSINHEGNKTASVRQIPLCLAWAMTVHKSQGMSLDTATVDLSGAFEYGQGYVALSRVRSLAGLYIEGLNARALQMHPRVVEQDKIFRKMSNEIKHEV